MNKEFIGKLREEFKKVPAHHIDQSKGFSYTNKPGCAVCFGAHIAKILNISEKTKKGVKYNFEDGKEEFYKLIGLNKLQAKMLLNKAGVGHNDTFGSSDWQKVPKIVLRNLLTMDKLCFKGEKIKHIVIREEDLQSENFENSKVHFATFTDCNFSGCSFKNAEIKNCVLDDSNFENANFCGTKMKGSVYFDHAIMTGATYDENTEFSEEFTERHALRQGMIKVETESKVVEFPQREELKEVMP